MSRLLGTWRLLTRSSWLCTSDPQHSIGSPGLPPSGWAQLHPPSELCSPYGAAPYCWSDVGDAHPVLAAVWPVHATASPALQFFGFALLPSSVGFRSPLPASTYPGWEASLCLTDGRPASPSRSDVHFDHEGTSPALLSSASAIHQVVRLYWHWADTPVRESCPEIWSGGMNSKRIINRYRLLLLLFLMPIRKQL